MSSAKHSCPLTYAQAVDRYFMEHRAKVIEIAAYLDRLDRTDRTAMDYRDRALRDCLNILTDDRGDKAQRVLLALSDQTDQPIPKAHTQGAGGAVPPKTD